MVKRFGGIRAVDGATLDVARGLDHRPDRAERRRQDHLLQRHHRLLQARWRPGRLRGQARPGAPAVRDRPPGHGAHVPDHQGLGPDAGDRQHDARGPRPAGRAPAQRHLQPWGRAPARGGGARAGDGAARDLQPGPAGRRLRRHPLGWAAQAAGAGPSADDQASLPASRRADGGHQPDAGATPARPHEAAASRAGRDVPVHRARHGGGHEPLRPGDRDGRGPRDRRRGATRGSPGAGRDRRLSGDRRRGRRARRATRDRRRQRQRRPAPTEDVDGRVRVRGRRPQRRFDPGPRWRDCHGDRSQRGRQVNPGQDDLRSPASPQRTRRVQRRGHHGSQAAHDHAAGTELRAPAGQRVPKPDGGGEPRNGLPGPGAHRRADGPDVRALPATR